VSGSAVHDTDVVAADLAGWAVGGRDALDAGVLRRADLSTRAVRVVHAFDAGVQVVADAPQRAVAVRDALHTGVLRRADLRPRAVVVGEALDAGVAAVADARGAVGVGEALATNPTGLIADALQTLAVRGALHAGVIGQAAVVAATVRVVDAFDAGRLVTDLSHGAVGVARAADALTLVALPGAAIGGGQALHAGLGR